MHTKSSRGFTLIELLVVIAIIGILSSVVLASLNVARKKGRDARRIADISQIKTALELYYDANSQYPTTLAPLTASNYIQVVPTDPSTNTAYSYAALQGGASSVATCGGYHLGATLEDSSNSALTNDIDAPASDTVCTNGGTNFSGTDPVYDVKQ